MLCCRSVVAADAVSPDLHPVAHDKPYLALTRRIADLPDIRVSGCITIRHDTPNEMGQIHAVHQRHLIAVPETRPPDRRQGIDPEDDDRR